MTIASRCALCLKVKGLVSTHYIPAFCYSGLREKSGRLRDPVLVTGKVSILQSRQLQHPLLCEDCEDRFNRSGERWVANHSARSVGSFKLRSLLRRQDAHGRFDNDPVYYAEFIRSINVGSLIYFAASVFWRGAAFDWEKLGTNAQRLLFAPEIVEDLRLFLMSDGPFPSSLNLQLEVDAHPNPMRLLFMPAQVLLQEGGPPAGYFFSACGLVFTILKHPWLERYSSLSIVDKPHPIRLTDKSTRALTNEARRIRATSRAVGKLGRSGPPSWRR
jgi:hypothetical protein